MLYPLTFNPIYKERVWGGRNLERLYGRKLPPDVSIGESWEITDRPEGVSAIANGPLAGRDLRWLMENHARELLGTAETESGRFPLLIKILDAQEKLSLQVHPPASMATRLGGEPKTEMWYIADARPGAELYAGLRPGVTRAEFERKVKEGTVADCFHRVPVRRGDVMFLPSGRVHAIGAGIVIFEIQQNSDTTYRVFDWNRPGLDGKPRELHIEQSLQCIDFNDFEPAPVKGRSYEEEDGDLQRRELVRDPLFVVEEARFAGAGSHSTSGATLEIVGVLEGELTVRGNDQQIRLGAGCFCLIPPGLPQVTLEFREAASFLRIRTGSQRPGDA